MPGKNHGAPVVVVMGVSASGKSTVGASPAERLGVPFLEGDDLHSTASRAKPASGRPLDDADREPWPAALAAWVRQAARGRGGVVTCSALRRAYRDELRATGADVRFVHLALDARVAARRIAARTGHFMLPRLLGAQYDTLEPLQPDEPGVTVDASGSPEQVVSAVLRALGEPDA